MKARKFISAVAALTMCAGLISGCSNGNDTGSNSTENTAEKSETAKTSEVSEQDIVNEEKSEERSLVFDTSQVTKTKTIAADGDKAIADKAKLYDGLGMVSANNSSRLLLDYKSEKPDAYQKLLEYMFGKDGMGLSLIKIEMGADVDSSSGTEPAVMRSENETADVTRGAGYQLAADALKINPDIKIDLLYWGLPNWVSNAEDSYDALYKWYKSTIDAMYDTYGIKVTHVTVNQNERSIDTEWVKYFSSRLKEEMDKRYDYNDIKIVCGEAVGTWGIANKMLEDEELLNAIDVVTSHYTSWTSDKVKTLQNEYGKEVWFSEGSSPMSYSTAAYRYDGTGSGTSDLNGMLDIATRITQAMAEGMTMYEFQPVVSSYYSGVTYFPKQIITANEPWSGAYSLDPGFYMNLHFSQFIGKDWQYIDGACFGDGKAGGDGHAIVDSTYNYITCVDQNKENCSVILVNNSAETIEYDIELSNMSCTESPFYVWETKGPEEGEDYFSGFFKKLGFVAPKDGTVKVVIKPYSMMTASTVNVTAVTYSNSASEILSLPYTDDFEYSDYAPDYLSGRGNAPRYTTDQGGAFEVETIDGNNVLVQKITSDIKPTDWGSTSQPVTNLGDDRWSDYSVSIDAHFADGIPDDKAYVGIGARYNLADSDFSGYWLKLWNNGKCDLMKDKSSVASAEIKNFDAGITYALKITVCENIIDCSVNGETVLSFEDTEKPAISGRAAIYSSYHNNYFDNLKIEAVDGYDPYITRSDDLDAEITYSEGSNVDDNNGWYHNTMCSFKNYNRTASNGHTGDTMEFSFSGSSFAVLGQTKSALIKVELDGEVIDTEAACAGGARQAAYYKYGLEKGEHNVKITVIDGILQVDAVEYK